MLYSISESMSRKVNHSSEFYAFIASNMFNMVCKPDLYQIQFISHFFYHILIGCGHDLQTATHLAELMVKEFAMSEKIGFRVYRNDETMKNDFGFSDEIKRNSKLP